jgi:hypothetical protein
MGYRYKCRKRLCAYQFEAQLKVNMKYGASRFCVKCGSSVRELIDRTKVPSACISKVSANLENLGGILQHEDI